MHEKATTLLLIFLTFESRKNVSVFPWYEEHLQLYSKCNKNT